jgi:8-oxo-dGTP diphosphatase
MNRFASVVVVDARGWVLLQERDEHPAIDPEMWGFCGGHVEPGEQVEAAAYRELAEETGLVLADGLEHFGDFTVFHSHTATDDQVSVYLVRLDLTDDDVDCREGRRIVFVEPSAARALDLTAAATTLLPRLLDSDHYRRLTT